VTQLVYEAIRAALGFARLPEIPMILRAFVEHIGRASEKTRPKQIEVFQNELRPGPG
jgi:hypothetical protein